MEKNYINTHCPFCGTEFEKDTYFCPKCHATFHDTEELRNIYDAKCIDDDMAIWNTVKKQTREMK